jgi:hypothetical protein
MTSWTASCWSLPAELPALLERFQLAVKFRTQNGTPVKRTRKPKEQQPQEVTQ